MHLEGQGQEKKVYIEYILSCAILLVAFALRVFRLDAQSMWWDEIITVFRSRLDWAGISANILARPVHVPLYFVLMHFWQAIGTQEFVVRFFSVLWGVLGVALLYRVGRLVGGREVGLVSAALAAVSPFSIWFAQENRMYTLAPFLALGANFCLLRLLEGLRSKSLGSTRGSPSPLLFPPQREGCKGEHFEENENGGLRAADCGLTVGNRQSAIDVKKKILGLGPGEPRAMPSATQKHSLNVYSNRWSPWLGYGLCVLAGIYTHYFFFLILLAHYAFLSLNYRRWKELFIRWLVCVAVVGVLFLPWAVRLVMVGGFRRAGFGWIPPARLPDPLLTLYTFGLGGTADPANPLNWVAALVLLTALGLGAAHALRTRHDAPGGSLMLCWLFLPLLVVFLISIDLPLPQKRSVYMDRYMTVLAPAFYVLVGQGMVLMGRKRCWLAGLAGGVLLLAVGLSLHNMYFDSRYFRDDWRGAAAFLRHHAQPDELLLFRPDHYVPLAYYSPGDMPREEIPLWTDPAEAEEYLQTEMPDKMARLTHQWLRFWLITSVENINAHGFPQERNERVRKADRTDAVKAWLDARYPIVTERAFPGILLTLYEWRRSE